MTAVLFLKRIIEFILIVQVKLKMQDTGRMPVSNNKL